MGGVGCIVGRRERGHAVKDKEQCRQHFATLLHGKQRGLNESNNKTARHVE